MAAADARTGAFELKGRMSTLTVLRLLNADPNTVLAEFERRLHEAPAMFDGMPLVIDPGTVADGIDDASLAQLADGLRSLGVAPMALTGEVDRATAAAAGLGVIAESGRNVGDAAQASRSAEPAPTQPTQAAARVVTQPVRSGQQIYARDGDLVLMASVSPGAEVLADGHVHIYGSLNGRAFAGVQGDLTARIFCRRLNPELVAIAGRYQIRDKLDGTYIGHEVQIALESDALTVAPLAAGA